jgi:hypothetical protein
VRSAVVDMVVMTVKIFHRSPCDITLSRL